MFGSAEWAGQPPLGDGVKPLTNVVERFHGRRVIFRHVVIYRQSGDRFGANGKAGKRWSGRGSVVGDGASTLVCALVGRVDQVPKNGRPRRPWRRVATASTAALVVAGGFVGVHPIRAHHEDPDAGQAGFAAPVSLAGSEAITGTAGSVAAAAVSPLRWSL